jgi:hypothetical protein
MTAGANVTQGALGILMLETLFERFPGDLGNPAGLPFPVLYRVAPDASAKRIVGITDDAFLEPFTALALEMIAEGAIGIATSCGFLAVYQDKLAARLPVPVLTSSLAQIPMVQLTLPAGKTVGVLTFSRRALTSLHLTSVGAPADVPVVGLPEGGVFQRAILTGAKDDSYEGREREAVAAAESLVARYPDIGAIVCECTNLAPHSAAIAKATGRPVFDILTALTWFWTALRPRVFPRPQ